MKTFRFGVSVLGLVILSQAGHGAVLFDNLSTPLGLFTTSSGQQVGDEIVLVGGAATVMGFSFEYFGSNFSSGESVQVSFYKNDGACRPAMPAPTRSCGPVPPFPFPEPSMPVPRPEQFIIIWSLLIRRIGRRRAVPGDFQPGRRCSRALEPGNRLVRILSSGPPTTGLDYNDYWLNTGTVGSPNWQSDDQCSSKH